MAKYAFSKGRVTVENGVYVPLLRDDKSKRRNVMVFVDRVHQQETAASNAKQEQTHVKS